MRKEKIQLLEDYIREMTSVMCLLYPEKDKKEMKKYIREVVYTNAQNFPIEWDNSYTGDHGESTFLSLTEWMHKRKPIIAGNATLFCRQDELLSPNSIMLDIEIGFRDKEKRDMFEGIRKGADPYYIMMKDIANTKLKATINSEYGISGSPYSAFYDRWCAPATTMTAQQVISTVEQAFETILGSNYVFISINELFDWINLQLKEDVIEDDTIQPITREELVEMLYKRMMKQTDSIHDLIQRAVSNMEQKYVTLLFYRLNLKELVYRNPSISDRIVQIIDSVKVYPVLEEDNWEMEMPEELKGRFQTVNEYTIFRDQKAFMDPNNPPEEILDRLQELIGLLMYYVYAPYISFDRVYRLRNFERYAVSTIDTDSDFIIMDSLLEMVEKVYRKKKETLPFDQMTFLFISTNLITALITEIANKQLNLYGEHAGIPKEFRGYYKMKNELLVLNMVLAKVKKRYLCKVVLREGVMLKKPKYNITGFEFRRASSSDKTEKVFVDMCKNRLMDPDSIDIKGLIRDIKQVQAIIRKSILDGEVDYLPIASLKAADAFANPERMKVVRACMIWNYLNPQSQIQYPSKGHMMNLSIFTEEELKALKGKIDDPIYNTIRYEVFENTNSYFMKREVKQKVDKKTGEVIETIKYTSKGIQAIVIPFGSRVPEYILPFCDVNSMINSIVSPMKSVLDIFNIPLQTEGKNRSVCNRQTSTITNILKF